MMQPPQINARKMYYITPNYSVAFIPKNGCSSLARATIKAFQPEQEYEISTAKYPDGKNEDNVQVQFLVNKELNPSKQVLAFIREPVQRFLSAMVQVYLSDVEQALTALEQGLTIPATNGRNINMPTNPHFFPQHVWMNNTAKLYRFPDHLEEGALEIGYSLPLPAVNPARSEKPVPTQEQEQRIRNYYSKDKELFDAISIPGVILQDVLGQDWMQGT